MDGKNSGLHLFVFWKLKEKFSAQVYTGKEYLVLAKDEEMAKKVFEHKIEENGRIKNEISITSRGSHSFTLRFFWDR